MSSALDLPAKPAGQVYVVSWKPDQASINKGEQLVFDYQQDRRRESGRLTIQYPFPVQGVRKARFTIPDKVIHKGGAIRSWRVSLLYQGQLLATQTSEK